MTYRLIALFFIAVFYFIYFAKMLLQRQKGIVTDQIAKSKVHDMGFYIEAVMKIATIAAPITEVISIVYGRSMFTIMFRVIGTHLAFLGDLVFLMAVWTMKDSWRAGVAKTDTGKRNLVTNGIYKYSRNPAFLGFDLVYLGILLMFGNPVLCAVTVWAIVMFHLQILQEEKFLEEVYGESYSTYKEKTSRYAGLGKLTRPMENIGSDDANSTARHMSKAGIAFFKICLYIYFILGVWSVLYFFTCLAYGGGPKLSWVWIWILIAAFSFARVWMLKARLEGREKIKIPAALKWIYRVVFALCLGIFIVTEVRIIDAMTAKPQENLDYIIVLGAGLHGTEPSNPFKARIEKAAEYLNENEGTQAVASGGQGRHEAISEAEAAKRRLSDLYGIDESRIILEDQSADTEQNLKFSLEIIGDADASVGIVTNGFHELRAMSIAREVGYKNVYSVPARTLFPVGIHYCVREFFGMMEFYVKYKL